MVAVISCDPSWRFSATQSCATSVAPCWHKLLLYPSPTQTQSKESGIAMTLNSERACSIAEMWPRPMMEELPNIAAYAYQDVHVWSAL